MSHLGYKKYIRRTGSYCVGPQTSFWGCVRGWSGEACTTYNTARLPMFGRPDCSHGLPGSPFYPNYILPLALEGRWACPGIILLSAFFSCRKQTKPQWHNELLFQKETYILGCLFRYPLTFVPEGRPSNLMSSEFKCSVQSFEIYCVFLYWSLCSFMVQF